MTTPARFAAGRAALVCLTAIVAAIVGVLGTWRSAGSLSLDDLEAPQNGWLVVIFGSRRNCLPASPCDGASLAKPPGAGV